MNENILANLKSFDEQLQEKTSELLSRIFNAQAQVEAGESAKVDFAKVQSEIGSSAIRVDIPIEETSYVITYLASADLLPELKEYLEKSGEDAPSVPDSMQLILDIAEQITLVKNEIVKSLLEKEISFGNPVIQLWNGESEPGIENGVASYFRVALNDKAFTVIRLLPEDMANQLFKQVVRDEEKVVVQQKSMEELYADDDHNGKTLPLTELYDLELEVTAELGSVNLTLKEILELGTGSIVELGKYAGDPVDLYINNKKFAEGEVVVVEQSYAVRITHLISAKERMASIA